MKREKTYPWKKYHPQEMKRYFKIWWRLLSQGRYREANRILMIYRYPPFWLPVIGLLVLYGIFSIPIENMTNSKATIPVPFENMTNSNIDWVSIRQAAWNRKSNVNFHAAKRKLYQIYQDLGLTKTFYCDCHFTLTPKRFEAKSCGLKLSKYKHAMGLDAEHIVPESFMGSNKSCWRSGGRKACEKDIEHQLAVGDLHNLVPSVPAINRLRSNYKPVDELPGEAFEFGACDIEIETGSFEPPPAKRGDIARTYLYMWHVYDAPLTSDDVAMFERWHLEDPPDANEMAIAKAKANIQGNTNPLILNP
ncbi:Endonuclease I [Beggiatoa sp. PS]|nr:Endonuclease I [Beggiatoa sp. PS]